MTLETLEGETWEAIRANVWRPIYDVTAPSINILVWKTVWASVRAPIDSAITVSVFNRIWELTEDIIAEDILYEYDT